MLNKFFDKIYLLNLKKDKKRLINSIRVSKEIGFKFELFEATHWSSFEVKNIIKDKGLFGHTHMTPGAIGCSYSHVQIIKDAILKKYKNILILEDDVLPSKNFKKILSDLYIPSDYNFLYLGGNLDGRKDFLIDYDDIFFKSTNIAGTYAWSINENVYEKCIFEISKFSDTADRSLAILHDKHPDFTYILKDQLFLPNIFDDSNIRNLKDINFKINWFKRMGFSYRDIHYKFRKDIPRF